VTQPSSDQAAAEKAAAEKAAAEKAAAEKAGRKVKRLDVVQFTHRDALLGREHTEVGVVVATADGGITVRPLREHTVTVDAAAVEPLSADDVG
jgi:hypothetical protein